MPEKPTVLVIEDYSDTRMLLSSFLRAHGFKVIEARDGKEGFIQANRVIPDLILMDLALPKMDGIEATRRIRQRHALSQTPILAISAYATGDVARDGQRARACVSEAGLAQSPAGEEETPDRVAYVEGCNHAARCVMFLRGARRVAMQYSARNEIPTVARVDAGAVELVRAMGPEVVSSAELVAQVESVLSADELASQAVAAELVAQAQDATAQEAARRVRAGNPATERELRGFAVLRMAEQGLVEAGGIVAVDAHAADPHSQAEDGVAGRSVRRDSA